ncbi:hypothetical protein TNCT_310501 [Trichonephila clavata]|uniref:Histone H2B n=1 Tax=Trichonephila clavata TaxID=2740835 RepID=A0A8X6GYW2_TRICU|nr:hypothetical protein TNCT_310501 [Trichonephila clavata]
MSCRVLKYTPQLRGKKKSKSKSMDAPKEFIRCAPNLLELIDPLAKADQDAKKMVGDILNQMCVQVINKSCELSEKNKKDGILGPQDVIGAVKDCLGPNMARHAIAEGTRNALRYTSGRSLYKSTDFAHKKRKQTLKQNEAFDAVITELKQRNGS